MIPGWKAEGCQCGVGVSMESGVITKGSVADVIESHKYNRAVRLHKLAYEAPMRLLAWRLPSMARGQASKTGSPPRRDPEKHCQLSR